MNEMGENQSEMGMAGPKCDFEGPEWILVIVRMMFNGFTVSFLGIIFRVKIIGLILGVIYHNVAEDFYIILDRIF